MKRAHFGEPLIPTGEQSGLSDAHYDEEDPVPACGGIGASGWSGWFIQPGGIPNF